MALLIPGIATGVLALGVHRLAAQEPVPAATEPVRRPKPAALVPTVPVTAVIIQRGAQVYRENCAVCHGADGRGDTPAARALGSPPADQTNPQLMEAFEDRDIASRIQHGGFQMPAFPQIRGEDLIAVVAYVRSLSRESVRSLEIQSLAQGEVKGFVPVTQAMLEQPAPGDWPMYRRTYDSWAYSPLDQVTRSNVGELELAWSRVMTPGRQYITPLAYAGVLYVENNRDIIQALDGRTGDLIWEYRYETAASRSARARGENAPDEKPVAPTEVRGTRNIAIYGDRIFHLTRDAHVIALDARTGALVWDVAETGAERGITHSAGPIVVDGKVISGRAAPAAGGPEVAYIAAHDTQTGRELWRFHTIPRKGEPGDETWGDVPYEDRSHVGSWSVGSYDPKLGILYWGTSVPAPSLEVVRGTLSGDALYSNSTVALDPDTGKLLWHYQHLPRDNWDLDHVYERYLLDAELAPDPAQVRWINPRLKRMDKRRVVSGMPGKTGIVYTLDAKTGEFLWARETVHQNVIKDIDVASGRVQIDEAMVPKPFQELRVCPSNAGGKNWMAGTYSPRTRLMYQPMLNMCMLQTGNADTFSRGMGYAVNWIVIEDPTITGRTQYPVGRLEAVSLDTGRIGWHYEQRAGIVSGLVSTAGGLVFGGDANRRFKAFDDETGKLLWETILAAPVSGHPVSFAVDGRQYIAVSTGGNTHPEKTALSLHPETKVTQGLNTLFVFRLRQPAAK